MIEKSYEVGKPEGLKKKLASPRMSRLLNPITMKKTNLRRGFDISAYTP